MIYFGVDLGSTNIKVAAYTQDMKLIDRQSYPVTYIRDNGFVEFDAATYCQSLQLLARPNLSLFWTPRERL